MNNKRITNIAPITAEKVLADTLHTPRGVIFFQGPLKYQEIQQLYMDGGLDNFRNPTEQQQTLSYISQLPEGRVYAACIGKTIIGYVTFHGPEFPRWNYCGLKELLELGGLEVSKNWRGLGVAQRLLEYAFSTHGFEDHIVISMETYSSWDLECSGMCLWEYRRMLEKLLSKVGMERRFTDDPEIADHPANMLTARLGANVSREARVRFEKLLFLKCNGS